MLCFEMISDQSWSDLLGATNRRGTAVSIYMIQKQNAGASWQTGSVPPDDRFAGLNLKAFRTETTFFNEFH